MRLKEFAPVSKDEKLDEFLPALAAAGGALARGAAMAGGAALRGLGTAA